MPSPKAAIASAGKTSSRGDEVGGAVGRERADLGMSGGEVGEKLADGAVVVTSRVRKERGAEKPTARSKSGASGWKSGGASPHEAVTGSGRMCWATARILQVDVLGCELTTYSSVVWIWACPINCMRGGQTDAGAHHVGGKGVSKPMRVGRQRDAGGLAMMAKHRS